MGLTKADILVTRDNSCEFPHCAYTVLVVETKPNDKGLSVTVTVAVIKQMCSYKAANAAASLLLKLGSVDAYRNQPVAWGLTALEVMQ